jgi:hypothetical protein
MLFSFFTKYGVQLLSTAILVVQNTVLFLTNSYKFSVEYICFNINYLLKPGIFTIYVIGIIEKKNLFGQITWETESGP